MNTDHLTGGASVTVVHTAFTTILHWAFNLELDLAQAFSIIGLSFMGAVSGLVQWWLSKASS